MCRWQVQVSVYCARRIPAHLRCTQCSFLLQRIDICFIPCIRLWQISHTQTCLCVVVGPGFASRSPSHIIQRVRMAGLPKTTVIHHCWGREVSPLFTQQFLTAMTAPPLIVCVVWSQPCYLILVIHSLLSYHCYLIFVIFSLLPLLFFMVFRLYTM